MRDHQFSSEAQFTRVTYISCEISGNGAVLLKSTKLLRKQTLVEANHVYSRVRIYLQVVE